MSRDIPAPAYLTARSQWVVWRYEQRDEGKKPTKVPFQALLPTRRASSTRSATWSDYRTALRVYQSDERWAGIGIVLTPDDDLVGVDLDHCIDEAGEVTPWAAEIVEALPSYAEISPSGHGVRIFLRSARPPAALKRAAPDGQPGAVEIYSTGRYLTVTGQALPDSPSEVIDLTDELDALLATLAPVVGPRKRAALRAAANGTSDHDPLRDMSDADLLQAMLRSKHGAAISRLLAGDMSDYAGDHSAADLALCSHLTWWCRGDQARVDRLFRSSGLYREKWNAARAGSTYGQQTMARAADAAAGGGFRGRSLAVPASAFSGAANGSSPSVDKKSLPNELRRDPASAPTPEGYSVPAPYAVTQSATLEIVERRDGDTTKLVAHAPIVITGIAENVTTGQELLDIAYRRMSAWRTLTAPRGALLNARRLIDLADGGMPVASDNSAAVAKYIHVSEAANLPILPRRSITEHLGWQINQKGKRLGFHTGSTWLPCPDGPDALHVQADDPQAGVAALLRATEPHGSMTTLLDGLAQVSGYPRVILGFYASLAAPLLSILGCPPGVVDWSCRTSTGKSILLRLAASVWGQPDEHQPASMMHTWSNTKVWAERTLAALASLPLVLDDTKQAAQIQGHIAQILYLAAGGRGKGRGTLTGVAHDATWHTLTLSSGEQPVTAYSQDGGTRGRCLCIRGAPFGSDDCRELVDRVNRVAARNYGHIGPLWMQRVIEHESDWDQWREYYDEHLLALAEAADETSGVVSRLAQLAAAIAVTTELAHSLLPLPWRPTAPVYDLWPAIARQAGGAHAHVRALHDVYDWARSQPVRFWGRHLQPDPQGGWLGAWDQEPWTEIAFLPAMLSEHLRRLGYEPEAILSAWTDAGWTRRESDGHPKIRMNGTRSRMICVQRSCLEDE